MEFDVIWDRGRNLEGGDGRKPSTVVGLILKSASDFSRHPNKSFWRLTTGVSALFPLLRCLLPRDLVLAGGPPFFPCSVCTLWAGFTIASYQSKFTDRFAGAVGNKTCPESRFRAVPASDQAGEVSACRQGLQLLHRGEELDWEGWAEKPPLLPRRSALMQFEDSAVQFFLRSLFLRSLFQCSQDVECVRLTPLWKKHGLSEKKKKMTFVQIASVRTCQ